MASTAQQPSEPPPSAANIATAYPRRAAQNFLPKILIVLTSVATLAVLFVHHIDHPIAHLIKFLFSKSPPPILTAPSTSPPPSPPPSRPPSPAPAPAQSISPGDLAICYSGHVGTHASIVQQNRDVIHRIDPEASIFYYIDLKDAYRNERTGVMYEKTHDIGTLQPIFDESQSVVQTFLSDDVVPSSRSKCHKRDGRDWEHYSHNYVTFFAASGCFDLLKQKEEERGRQYEWVLSLRPDMNIAVRMPPEKVQKRVHLSGAAMALIPREMADIYFSIKDAFDGDKCAQFDAMGDEPCKDYAYESEVTECLIIKWLKKEGIVPSNGVYVNRRIVYPAAHDS